MSEYFSAAALGAGITANAAFEGLKVITTVAHRKRREDRWAKALISSVDAQHPGLLDPSEPRRLTSWLVEAGVGGILQHDREQVAARLLVALRNDVLESHRPRPGRTPSSEQERAARVFRAVVGQLVSELGAEVVHVLAAATEAADTTGGRDGALEELIEREVSRAVLDALERERLLSHRVGASALLTRPFLRLEGVSSPTTLMRPVYGVVPFDDSGAQLQRLLDWSTADARHSLVTLLGPAGSGKTRLAAELCRALARDGWRTGSLAAAARLDSAEFAAFMQWNARRAIIVDYAEDRPEHVRTLLTRLHGSGSRAHPVRVVLLVRRSHGAGWRSVFRGSDGDDLLDAADQIDVIDAWQHIDRSRFFMAAQTAFTTQLQRSSVHRADPPPWVDRPHLDTPLLLGAAALADLLAESDEPFAPSERADDLLDGVLAHEANYWRGSSSPPLDVADRVLVSRALIAAALGQPAAEGASEAAIADRLALCVDLRAESDAIRRQWARWILGQYPGGRFEPDLFLERIVIEQCSSASSRDPIDWGAALARDRRVADLDATLSLISRAARRSPHFAETVTEAWSSTLAPLVALSESAGETDDANGALLTSLATASEVLPITAEVERVALDLPGEPRFGPLGVILLKKALTALQDRDHNHEDVFAALVALGVYYGFQAMHDDAVAATSAAVEWVRTRVSDDGADQSADLARALANLGADLSGMGEHAAAVSATEEAVSLYRQLAEQGSVGPQRDLAFALHNLGGSRTGIGDHEGALAATEESVALVRHLVPPTEEDRSQAAVGLTNLALCLLRLGRAVEALVAAQDAVELTRRYAPSSLPDQHAQLVLALSTLSSAAARTGDIELALASQREAVRLTRRLYAIDPRQHSAELARRLRVLAKRLHSVGLVEEAVRARREATDLALGEQATH